MRRIITLGILTLALSYSSGCSSLAYVLGYNMVSDRDIVLITEKPAESEKQVCPACKKIIEKQNVEGKLECKLCGYTDAKFSKAAYMIAMVETGGGYLRKSPTEAKVAVCCW